MATYAVRLSKESNDDEAIFETAKTNCAGLATQRDAAIQRDVPARQATELRAMLAQEEKPSFLAMLAKIRSDRTVRSAP